MIENHRRHPEVQSGRNDLGLHLSCDHAVAQLEADRTPEVAPIADPKEPRPTAMPGGWKDRSYGLCRVHQVVEGREGLLEQGVWVGMMGVEQIDVVGAEPPQAPVQLFDKCRRESTTSDLPLPMTRSDNLPGRSPLRSRGDSFSV